MMPLSEVKNITEFILVPSLWGCCYGQPPAVNHIVVVKMRRARPRSFASDVIRVRGHFNVGETKQDGYLVSLYVLTAEKIDGQWSIDTKTVFVPIAETPHAQLRPLGGCDAPVHTHVKLDRLGMWLSAICAVHCAVVPVVQIFFPVC